MDDRQQRRVARNQSRFREMNERTRRGIDAFEEHAEHYPIMCECAVSECNETIQLSRADYARARAMPGTFIVLPDHVMAAAEVVVERTDSFWIIQKLPDDGLRVAAENYNGGNGPS